MSHGPPAGIPIVGGCHCPLEPLRVLEERVLPRRGLGYECLVDRRDLLTHHGPRPADLGVVAAQQEQRVPAGRREQLGIGRRHTMLREEAGFEGARTLDGGGPVDQPSGDGVAEPLRRHGTVAGRDGDLEHADLAGVDGPPEVDPEPRPVGGRVERAQGLDNQCVASRRRRVDDLGRSPAGHRAVIDFAHRQYWPACSSETPTTWSDGLPNRRRTSDSQSRSRTRSSTGSSIRQRYRGPSATTTGRISGCRRSNDRFDCS